MASLAIRNLLAEKVRFSIAVFGVAFSVFLVALFVSLYRGFTSEIDDYIESVPADLWLTQFGTRDFTSASILPDQVVERLRQESGGAGTASALVSKPAEITIGGERVKVGVVGFDTSTGLGGPRVVRGRLPGPGEMAVDRVLAKQRGLHLGDRVRVGSREFEVAGIATGGNFVYTQLVFLTLDDARSVLGYYGVVNFVLLDLVDAGQISSVRASIYSSAPFINAFTRDEFVSNTRAELTRALVPLLLLIIVVGIIVGTAVVSLTIYTLTVEHTREYGFLKAVGFTNLDLVRVVMLQSLISGALGFAIGMAIVTVAGVLLDAGLPQFATSLPAVDAAFVLLGTMAMGIGAAYVPVRRIARVDPVVVFSG